MLHLYIEKRYFVRYLLLIKLTILIHQDIYKLGVNFDPKGWSQCKINMANT